MRDFFKLLSLSSQSEPISTFTAQRTTCESKPQRAMSEQNDITEEIKPNEVLKLLTEIILGFLQTQMELDLIKLQFLFALV